MTSEHSKTPTRREILKPAELVLLSAGLAVFVGLVVLMSTRQPVLAVVFFGIAFIVSLVVIAMFTLTFKPNAAEQQELRDEDEGGASGGSAGPYLGPGPTRH